ncbi:MAG: hypothetical protein ACRELY_04010 [Polyangiaceae bacterium]
MATQSEQFHADEQRRDGAKKRKKASQANERDAQKVRGRAKKKGHTESKATYALEQKTDGKRPSRKSTRKSANHAKSDAGLTRVEQQRKGSPDAAFRKSRARSKHPRGKGAQ